MIITEANRTYLRKFHIADLDRMAEIFADAEVMRFGPGPQSREFAQQWLERCLDNYHRHWGFGLWAVVSKQDRRVMGYCGLERLDDVAGQPEIELGFALARSHWGQGFATEVVQAAKHYATDVLGIRRLVSLIAPENTASIRVAERNGLQYEKEVQVGTDTLHMYAVGQRY